MCLLNAMILESNATWIHGFHAKTSIHSVANILTRCLSKIARYHPVPWKAWIIVLQIHQESRYSWSSGYYAGAATNGWLILCVWRRLPAHTAVNNMPATPMKREHNNLNIATLVVRSSTSHFCYVIRHRSELLVASWLSLRNTSTNGISIQS